MIKREELRVGEKYNHIQLGGVTVIAIGELMVFHRWDSGSEATRDIQGFLNTVNLAPKPKKKIKLNYWLSGKDVIIVTDSEMTNTNYTNMYYKLIKSEEIEVEDV